MVETTGQLLRLVMEDPVCQDILQRLEEPPALKMYGVLSNRKLEGAIETAAYDLACCDTNRKRDAMAAVCIAMRALAWDELSEELAGRDGDSASHLVAQWWLLRYQSALPAPGSVWRHYRGGLYTVTGMGVNEHYGTPVLFYRSVEKGYCWSRPITIWFEHVQGQPRFVLERRPEK